MNNCSDLQYSSASLYVCTGVTEKKEKISLHFRKSFGRRQNEPLVAWAPTESLSAAVHRYCWLDDGHSVHDFEWVNNAHVVHLAPLDCFYQFTIRHFGIATHAYRLSSRLAEIPPQKSRSLITGVIRVVEHVPSGVYPHMGQKECGFLVDCTEK